MPSDFLKQSIADLIPRWYEGGTVEAMLEEALGQIRILEDRIAQSETPRVAHSKSEYRRLTAQGAEVLPPAERDDKREQSEVSRCTCYVLPHEDDCGIFIGITQSGERVLERRSGADRRASQGGEQKPVAWFRDEGGGATFIDNKPHWYDDTWKPLYAAPVTPSHVAPVCQRCKAVLDAAGKCPNSWHHDARPPVTRSSIGQGAFTDIERRIVEMIRYISVKAGVADTVYGEMCHEARCILRNAHLDYTPSATTRGSCCGRPDDCLWGGTACRNATESRN